MSQQSTQKPEKQQQYQRRGIIMKGERESASDFEIRVFARWLIKVCKRIQQEEQS